LSALIVLGLAVTLGVLAFVFKRFGNLIALGIGFLAGGAVALNVLDLLSLNAGLWSFLLALGLGAVGALLARRFYKWVIVIVAALVGALLVVRGLEWLVSGGLNDALASILALGLAGLGIWYNLRQEKQT
jgi:hypothetical protein